MQDFSNVMRELRRRSGLSQKEVAEKLTLMGIRVNNAHVSRWESGVNHPSIEQFVGLCTLYHVTNVNETFGDGLFAPALIGDLSDEGVQRLREYRQLLLHNDEYSINPGVFEAPPLPSDSPPAPEPEPAVRFVRLPCYNLAFPDPFSKENEKTLEVREETAGDADYAVVIAGTALMPALAPGQGAWVDTKSTVRLGDYGLFRVNGYYYVRKLRRVRGRVVLGAVNRAYAPIMLGEGETFETLGAVSNPESSPPVPVPEEWAVPRTW